MAFIRTISAFNTATASENKIHDDATASRFGFLGGLVPGVDVFAYLAHAPLRLWGPEWLSQGGIRARFIKPVYDGDAATVTAELDADCRLKLALYSRNELCAEALAERAALGAVPKTPPAADQPRTEDRPKAGPASLQPDRILGYAPETYTKELGHAHLLAVREDLALYEDGRIASPAYLLRRANYILAENVVLGPWIHVESDIRLHRVLSAGDLLETRARVVDNVERKGHRIVTLQFAILASGALAMSGRHTAIYEPRQVRS